MEQSCHHYFLLLDSRYIECVTKDSEERRYGFALQVVRWRWRIPGRENSKRPSEAR
jgi:hypothetical protein